MKNARKAPEADVILGAFATTRDVPPDQALAPCEVIDFAPFLTTRRQRGNASVVPSADPA